MNDEIIQLIRNKRPNLADSSVKTYRSCLVSLYDKVKKKHPCSFDDFLSKEKEILDELKSYAIPKAKTTLSALYVVTGNNNYRRDMIDLCKKDSEFLIKQEATETQKDVWVTMEDMQTKWKELYPIALRMLDGKDIPDFVFLNAFMLFSLLSGIFIPPRRPLDFCDMIIKPSGYDKKKDNYYNSKTGEMVINKYKTAKYYGTYTCNLKSYPELFTLLKKWCKINPTPYLLFSKSGK